MILNLMKKVYAPLIFGLFCGLVYFGLAFVLISNYTDTGGNFLAFLFAPAVICGAALIIVKAVKMYVQAEAKKNLNFLFWSHIMLAVVSLTLVIGVII